MNAPTEKVTFSPEQVAAAAEASADPSAIVQVALKNLAQDKGAMFAGDVIDALTTIRSKNEAEYFRLIANAKGCKTQLDKLTKSERDTTTPQDNQHDLILSIAQDACTFAHTAEGKGVALIETGCRREVHLIDGPGFKKWLRSSVYTASRRGVPDHVMSTALATIGAIADHEGEQIEVHLRCAKYEGAYFIDLCDETWGAIRVDATGWKIIARPPVYFIRSNGMHPLPTPTEGGNLEKLWGHVNIPAEAHDLVTGWLLESLRPDTPYPVLELTGEMGAAKSTAQRRLRALIDPNESPLRSKPKTAEDIHIAASNSYVCSFENLSGLPSEQQDTFCIVSTGGSYAGRQLYTNGDEYVMKSKRPVVLNGINPVATQPDLIERTISVELPTITTQKRMAEQSLEIAWSDEYPAIFSGLIELFAKSLKLLPAVVIPDELKKRMLDYQQLGEAACMATGKQAGDFSKAYDTAQNEGILRGLESFGITNAVQVLMGTKLKSGKRKPWEGTYLQLLVELNTIPGVDKSNWPRSAKHLSQQLKRTAPGLRKLGISIERAGRTSAGQGIKITRV